ncbi:MAG: restriction endonuclease subunit S, partial [Candidatus Nanopelagicales bacterium]
MTSPDWKTRELGAGMRVKHGFGFKGEYFSDSGELIVLTPGNFLEEGGFKLKSKEKFYDGPVPDGYLLGRGDVVVAMTEQSKGLLGSTATLPSDDTFLHNQRLGLLQITDPTLLDLRFCYHALNAPTARNQIQATATGSKVRHTAPERIESVRLPLPPLGHQRKIAVALDSIELLIENNRRRIELLEEMARLLYREWFVHFRFPGHEDVELVDSELGPIPEGWVVARFSGLVTESKTSVAESDIPPGSALVGLEHLPRRSTTLSEWAVAETVGSRRRVFASGDILFGKIRPYFHKVVDAPMDGYSSTDAIVFRPSEYPERALCIASSDEFVAAAVATSNGTKMPRANTELLLQYRIPEPPSHVSVEFDERVEPMSALRRNLSQQNRVL